MPQDLAILLADDIVALVDILEEEIRHDLYRVLRPIRRRPLHGSERLHDHVVAAEGRDGRAHVHIVRPRVTRVGRGVRAVVLRRLLRVR